MDFIMSHALFYPSQLCEAFAEAAQTYVLHPIEAMIVSFWEADQGVVIRTYAQKFRNTTIQEAIDYINASVDTGPVTKEKWGSTDIDASQYTSLSSYFEKNDANHLVTQEKAYLEQRGYDIYTEYYSMIPFPSVTLPKALVFLIAHDLEEPESFNHNMQSIIGKASKNYS